MLPSHPCSLKLLFIGNNCKEDCRVLGIQKQDSKRNFQTRKTKSWTSDCNMIFLLFGTLCNCTFLIKYHCAVDLVYLFIFFFSGPHLWHMEVPRLGLQLELQLLAYAIATVTLDLSHVCDLHHSSQQCQILNPLSKARE